MLFFSGIPSPGGNHRQLEEFSSSIYRPPDIPFHFGTSEATEKGRTISDVKPEWIEIIQEPRDRLELLIDKCKRFVEGYLQFGRDGASNPERGIASGCLP
jgi:hypothetical protein